MRCKNCGKEITDRSKFCTFCGAEVTEEKVTEEKVTEPKITEPIKPTRIKEPAIPTEPASAQEAPAQRGKSPLLICCLLLAIAGIGFGGGMMLFMQKNQENSQSDYLEGASSVQATASAEPTPTPVQEETATPFPTAIVQDSVDASAIQEQISESNERTEETQMERNDAMAEDENEELERAETTVYEYGSPEIESVSATGNVTDEYGDYVPKKAIDRNEDTAWASDGAGNSITVKLKETAKINEIQIKNGYWKKSPGKADDYLYYRNSRPKDITISFSDGTVKYATLNDVYREENYIYLDEGVIADSFTISIDSVYPGSVYNDTCITEISAE